MPIRGNNNKHGKASLKPKFEGRPVETAKAAATEAPADPTLLLLQLRPRNNYSEWEKQNKLYFTRKYGNLGNFFETGERYCPEEPKRPTVRQPLATAAASSSSTVSSSSSANAAPRHTRGKGSKPTSDRAAPPPEEKKDDSGDSESDTEDDSSDDDSVYNIDAKADTVESAEAAEYIFRKRLDVYVKSQEYYRRIQPQMFADLLRSLGADADATVRTSSKFDTAEREREMKFCCEKYVRKS